MTLRIHQKLLISNQFMEMSYARMPEYLKGFDRIPLRYLADKLSWTSIGILILNIPNPSNAEAFFVESKKDPKIIENHLNPVMLVFI